MPARGRPRPSGLPAGGATPPHGGRRSAWYLAGARSGLEDARNGGDGHCRARSRAAARGEPRRPLRDALSIGGGGGGPECPVGVGAGKRRWREVAATERV